MTKTLSTIIVTVALLVFAFGVLSYFTNSAVLLNTADAWGSTCGSCDDTPSNPPSTSNNEPRIPKCTLTATPSKIFAGESAQLSWTSQYAETGTINKGVGDVSPKNTDGRRSVSPTVDTTYTMQVTASNGKTAVCSATVKIKPVVIDYPPVCTLKATPTWINKGESSTLTWTSQNAETGTINQGVGEVSPKNVNGTRIVSPTADTTYTLTVTSATGKTATCSAPVKIKVVHEVIPTCTLKATPAWISKGESSTLTWTSNNAISGSINQGVGGVDPSNTNGTRMVSPTNDTTYTMTVVSSTGKTATCDAPVKIKTVHEVIPSCTLSASPSWIHKGGSSSLSWTSNNAISGSINQGVGDINPTNTDGRRSVSPSDDTTYTLTVVSSTGKTASCSAPVQVKTVDTPIVSCDLFNIDKTEVEKGESFTISWNTTNAENVSINNGVGNVASDGSMTTSVQDSSTFTLTATRGSQSVNCSDSISIKTSNGGGGGGGSSSPRCELKVSDKSISKGQEVKLTWDTSRATEVTLKDNFGKTLIDTDDLDNDDKKDFYDGDIKVRPLNDTTYTLVAEKGSKDRTCKVTVDVDSDITVLEIRDQKPLVGGISLTQVPYTGFDAGPTLTFIFYGLLALWGAFIAYTVVLKKEFLGFKFKELHPTHTYIDASVEAPVAESYVASATAHSTIPVNLPIANPIIGYEAFNTPELGEEALELNDLENQAHAKKVLLSSDAMRYFIAKVENAEDRISALEVVIAKARVTFSSEDGWVVLNLARMEELVDALNVQNTDQKEEENTDLESSVSYEPMTAGSLAETLVMGNRKASFEMITHRPMIALADAVSDLNAVYRARHGEVVTVSNMLRSESSVLGTEIIGEMIEALTSALDGTHTNEEEAVKSAIEKTIAVLQR